MDELTLLAELGEEIDRTAPEPSPRTRHRVVAGLAGDSGRGRGSWFTAHRWVPVGGALLAGGLAASVAAALAVGGGGVGGGTGPVEGVGPSPVTSETSLDARAILLAAARTARETPVPAPDPRAFVYTRTQERGMGSTYLIGGGTSWREYSSTREAWLSVDGSRDGAVTPSGSTTLVEIRAHEGTPAYQADLPVTADAMKDYLYRDAGKGQKDGDDAVAFEAGRALAQESYLPSTVRAALFEAMAAIPGVESVADAVNVAGEHGVAVTYRIRDRRDELLFDPRSHRVIGTRSVFLGSVAGLSPGTVMYTSAVLESAVVDEVRERPDGTLREGPIDDGGEKQRIADKERAAAEGAGEAAKTGTG